MKLPRILSTFLTHITKNRSRVSKRSPEYVRDSREDLEASRSRPTYSVFIMFSSRKLLNNSSEFLFYLRTSSSCVIHKSNSFSLRQASCMENLRWIKSFNKIQATFYFKMLQRELWRNLIVSRLADSGHLRVCERFKDAKTNTVRVIHRNIWNINYEISKVIIFSSSFYLGRKSWFLYQKSFLLTA